jgi:hypothetical protein
LGKPGSQDIGGHTHASRPVVHLASGGSHGGSGSGLCALWAKLFLQNWGDPHLSCSLLNAPRCLQHSLVLSKVHLASGGCHGCRLPGLRLAEISGRQRTACRSQCLLHAIFLGEIKVMWQITQPAPAVAAGVECRDRPADASLGNPKASRQQHPCNYRFS